MMEFVEEVKVLLIYSAEPPMMAPAPLQAPERASIQLEVALTSCCRHFAYYLHTGPGSVPRMPDCFTCSSWSESVQMSMWPTNSCA